MYIRVQLAVLTDEEPGTEQEQLGRVPVRRVVELLELQLEPEPEPAVPGRLWLVRRRRAHRCGHSAALRRCSSRDLSPAAHQQVSRCLISIII